MMILIENVTQAIDKLIEEIEDSIIKVENRQDLSNKVVAAEWRGRVLGMRLEIQDLEELKRKIEEREI